MTNAQNNLNRSTVKTTNEEYDFLTKTYSNDNSKTLEGYSFSLLYSDSVGDFNFVYQLFIETKTNKVKAVLIKITKQKKNNDKIRYLCLPINNDELFDEFNFEANKLGISMLMFFECINKALLSRFIDDKFNTNN